MNYDYILKMMSIWVMGIIFVMIILLVIDIIIFEIKCWYANHAFKYYKERTNTIETVPNFRWQQEMWQMLLNKQKPWLKGYVVNHCKRNIIFKWVKPIVYSTSHEIIKGSDFIIDGMENLSEETIREHL